LFFLKKDEIFKKNEEVILDIEILKTSKNKLKNSFKLDLHFFSIFFSIFEIVRIKYNFLFNIIQIIWH